MEDVASITTVNLLKLTEKIKLSPLLTVTSRFGQHSFGQEGLWIQMEAEQTLNRRIIHQPQFTAALGPSHLNTYSDSDILKLYQRTISILDLDTNLGMRVNWRVIN